MAKQAPAGETLLADKRETFSGHHLFAAFEASIALLGAGVKGIRQEPTRMHFEKGIEAAPARGEQAHDKGETLRQRAIPRGTRAAAKERRR